MVTTMRRWLQALGSQADDGLQAIVTEDLCRLRSLSEREQGKELLVEMVVSDADDKSDGYNRRFHPDSDDAGSSKCELPCSEEERFVLQAQTRKMGLSQMILFTS